MSGLLKAGPVVVALIWLGALAYYLPGTVNYDSAWYLYAAREWLDGARLYVDILETNPPLIFYHSIPPVLLSRWIGLGLMPAFVVWVLLLTLVVFGLCVTITGQARMDNPRLWNGLLTGALITSLVLPMGTFGQREHLAVVLSLGYFFASAVRAAGHPVGRKVAMAAGLLAGLGLSLKPFFLLAPVALEFREVVGHRKLSAAVRCDSVALGSVVLLYAIGVPLLHPEYLRDIVPIAVATYTRGYVIPWDAFLARRTTIMLGGVLAAYMVARPAIAHRRETDTFWLAAAGFFAAYVWQMKGFSYHIAPVLALVFISLLPVVLDGPPVGDRGLILRPRRLVAFVASVVIATLVLSGGRFPSSKDTALYELIEREAPGTITVFGPAGFPLVVEADVKWGSRFVTIWPVPGIWRALYGGTRPSSEEARRLAEINNWTRRVVAEDLQKYRPDLVIVNERSYKGDFAPLEFDWLVWAAGDSVFMENWANYSLVGTLEGLTIYRRMSLGP